MELLPVVLWLAVAPAWPAPAAPPAPWNHSGHRIVSGFAWAHLDGATRAEVARLLRAHPRFAADLQAGLADGADAAEQARHAFALASNWPDLVRSVSHPMHRAAHQSRWHYVDLPFVRGDVVPPPPAAAGDGPADVVAAIAYNLAVLADRQRADGERAIALCWVVHLVEDLHQPLHACSLYSPQFPTGDRGGNAFLVTRHAYDPDSRTSLHALWDALLGDYQTPAFEQSLVAGLLMRPDLRRERFAAELAVTEPLAWAQESHALARRHAYRDGQLAGAAADGPDAARPPLLPLDYVAAAEAVALPRAALAAHRLVDVLHAALRP
ncbi:MAG: S1/P1 nuclease [Planctomycetes bacterium]|nr:S1/P1 nuclease [Planctomycetota bacterium]